MEIHNMTPDECLRALERLNYGRLGCARDNQPYVVPVYFAFDGRHLYGFSTPGQKIDWMRDNPLVCLQVDERTSPKEWVSVVVSGRYEELPDAPEFAADRAAAQQALGKHAAWWGYTAIPAAEWRRKAGAFAAIFYRVHIDALSGHQATDPQVG